MKDKPERALGDVLVDRLRAGGLVPVSKFGWTREDSPARVVFEKAWAQVLAELELRV